MFFLKKEDRPGRALPPAAHDSARKCQAHRLGGLNPLGKSRGFRSWRDLDPILALSWLILAFKTPPRASKTLPRRPQEPPRRPQDVQDTPSRRPKNHVFPTVFKNVFVFQSNLDPTRPPRRLQGPPGRLQDASRAFKIPPRASKTHPQASKTPPRASKTPPRPFKVGPRHPPRAPKIKKIAMFNNFFAFLGLFGDILALHGCENDIYCHKNALRMPRRASKMPPTPSKRPQAITNDVKFQVPAKLMPSPCQISKYARDVCPRWSISIVYCKGHACKPRVVWR